MTDKVATPGFEGLLALVNADSKKAAEKLCKGLVVTKDDFFHLILGAMAGGMSPYRYANHFSKFVPEDLHHKPHELRALAENGVGPLKDRAAITAVNKISETFRSRRLFCAHLLYHPDTPYWALFYFDQRDQDPSDNHWIGGAHIHFCSDVYTRESLDSIWQKVCGERPAPPKGSHLRYLDERKQRSP